VQKSLTHEATGRNVQLRNWPLPSCYSTIKNQPLRNNFKLSYKIVVQSKILRYHFQVLNLYFLHFTSLVFSVIGEYLTFILFNNQYSHLSSYQLLREVEGNAPSCYCQ
jgi:hypothetical protein